MSNIINPKVPKAAELPPAPPPPPPPAPVARQPIRQASKQATSVNPTSKQVVRASSTSKVASGIAVSQRNKDKKQLGSGL